MPRPARMLAVRSRRWGVSAIVAAVVAVAIVGTALALDRSSGPPTLFGNAVDRRVPLLRLENEHGGTTSTADWRGRVVVLTPFLTLCHEVCPLTTAAFEALQHDVARAGLGRRVVMAEVSVDPWRDTPGRLRAFARLTHARFPLFTGTARELQRFWRFFGVAYWRTKEGTPPDTDWRTGAPLTFDVSHTDALIIIDEHGHERIVDVGMPTIGPRLPDQLERLLDAQGRTALAHPEPGWSLRQALDDLQRVLGRPIPQTS